MRYRQTPATMSDLPHAEKHPSNSDLMRNFIIGFSDGLTVPFALTAGISALGSRRLVILAGVAELASGAISMGLGAYLAAAADAKQYAVEETREKLEIIEQPLAEEKEIYDIFSEYGIHRLDACLVVERLKENPEMWLKVSQWAPFTMLAVLIHLSVHDGFRAQTYTAKSSRFMDRRAHHGHLVPFRYDTTRSIVVAY